MLDPARGSDSAVDTNRVARECWPVAYPEAIMRKHLDSITALAALCAALVAGGCQKETNPPAPKTANVPIDVTAQTATPPPPGDSTPKPAEDTKLGQPSDAGGKSGSQSTVGTSANGAPPETQQSAPEGNPTPKGGDVKR
jgi:hypothetical protein